jgi:hypothetical protein
MTKLRFLRVLFVAAPLLAAACSAPAGDDTEGAGAAVSTATAAPPVVDIQRDAANKSASSTLKGSIGAGTLEGFASAVEGLQTWGSLQQPKLDDNGQRIAGSPEAPVFKSIALVSNDQAALSDGRTLAVKLVVVAPGPVGNVDVSLSFAVKLRVADGVLHVDMSNTTEFKKFPVGEILKVDSYKLGFVVRAKDDGLAVEGQSSIRLEKQDQLGPRFVELVLPIFEAIKQHLESAS